MQKFINILVVVLAAVAIYSTIIVDYQRVKTMTALEASDVELQGHKDYIDEAYRRLTLRFEGRGKHMQRMQTDIANLNSRLGTVTDSLGNKIEETNFQLREVEDQLRESIRNLESDLRSLNDDITTYKRRTNRSILDLQELIKRVDSDLTALQEKLEPEEEE